MAREMEDLRQQVLANFPEVHQWLDFESAFEQSWKQALPRVNRDVPRALVVQFTGDGSDTEFEITDYFDKEISEVVSVEYPTGENPREYLKRDDDYFVYQDHNDDVWLVLVNDTPSATENLRVLIKTPHDFDNLTSTLGEQAFNALSAKTCELMALKIWQRLISVSMPSMDADAVKIGADQMRNMRDITKKWADEYKTFAGLDEDVKAAHAQADADIVMTTGRDYVWHPRRAR